MVTDKPSEHILAVQHLALPVDDKVQRRADRLAGMKDGIEVFDSGQDRRFPAALMIEIGSPCAAPAKSGNEPVAAGLIGLSVVSDADNPLEGGRILKFGQFHFARKRGLDVFPTQNMRAGPVILPIARLDVPRERPSMSRGINWCHGRGCFENGPVVGRLQKRPGR